MLVTLCQKYLRTPDVSNTCQKFAANFSRNPSFAGQHPQRWLISHSFSPDNTCYDDNQPPGLLVVCSLPDNTCNDDNKPSRLIGRSLFIIHRLQIATTTTIARCNSNAGHDYSPLIRGFFRLQFFIFYFLLFTYQGRVYTLVTSMPMSIDIWIAVVRHLSQTCLKYIMLFVLSILYSIYTIQFSSLNLSSCKLT